jgi:tetratricopeptide (TPR) repeat protein
VAQASADLPAGTARHTDTFELLLGLAQRDGDRELKAVSTVLLTAAKSRKKEVRLKNLAVSALTRRRDWSTLSVEGKALSESEPGWIHPGFLAQVAVAHAEMGKRDAALEALKKMSETPFTQEYRSIVLSILGDYAGAAAECDTALTNDKLTAGERRSLLVEKARTLNRLKKHAESEAILRELLDADPDDVLVLNNLGYDLADQNRKLDEADDLVRRAIDLDRWERARAGRPEAESGGYADSLGWVLFRRGKMKEAREQLEKAVASPESADDGIVWDHLGDVAFRQGDKKRAGEAWRQAAKLYEKSHTGRELGRLDEVKAKARLADDGK